MNFSTFISDNSSAVFALAGALGAGFMSLATAWLLRRQDYSLKLWEKISERRIQAHEQMLEYAMDMRVMVALGHIDGNGDPLRTPLIMMSQNNFENSFAKFKTTSASTWQTTELKREANFVQDYMINLYHALIGMPDSLYPNVGLIIRQDFIDLSTSLEKIAFRFFETDIKKLKLDSLSNWHKYRTDQTINRLQKTKLFENRSSILDRSHPHLSTPFLAEENN